MRIHPLSKTAHSKTHARRVVSWVRRVLALYVCTLVVALVSPWVHAQQQASAFPTPALEQICTDHSVQWVAAAEHPDAAPESASHAAHHAAIEHLLDCPMCLPAALAASVDVALALPPRVGIVPLAWPRIALPATSATPFLARAPPV